MCVDFGKLKDVTRRDAFPLPRIDQILDHLYGDKSLSSLDLNSGYSPVPLAELAIPKIAFVAPDGGHCEFLRLPFVLCNAPATNQRLITTIFNKYLCSFVLNFLNNFSSFQQVRGRTLQTSSNCVLRATERKLEIEAKETIPKLSYELRIQFQCPKNFPNEDKIKALKD